MTAPDPVAATQGAPASDAAPAADDDPDTAPLDDVAATMPMPSVMLGDDVLDVAPFSAGDGRDGFDGDALANAETHNGLADDDAPTSDDERDEIVEPSRVTFADLGLSAPVLRAVAESGYLVPTPIQEQAIPVVLMGRDVLGCAQTGTGKTAGFTLPMLDILASGRAKARMPRSLILEPTRELALQVAENFVKYGAHLKLVHALLIGGESMEEQTNALTQGVDVLIATPGRLLDLFERGRILLADCKVLVIDEADRMLDMGFIPDVERIVSLLPKMRQTLFFSATMAPEIRRLADAFLRNPKEISVSAPASVATTITAGLAWVHDMDKREALRRLLAQEPVQNALIFCNRKVDVDILYKSLKKHGFSVGALHGDMDQPSRFATLNKFKANELQLLVCSDVAARGLDIGGLSHVFNFDVPYHAEDYVHRIGRTGRAGREGRAYTIAVSDDARSVAAIEKLTGKPIPRIVVDGLELVSAEAIAEAATSKRRGGRSGGRPVPSAGAGRETGAQGGSQGSARSGATDPRRSRGGGSRDQARRDAAQPGSRDVAPARREEASASAPRRDASEPAHRDVSDLSRRETPSAARRDGPGPAPRRDSQAARRDAPVARRDDGQQDDRARETRPVRADTRGPEPRRDDRRRDEPRREEPRRRERDDQDVAVRGFGDAVPAFMLIPIPRRVRETATEATEEAA